MIYPKQENEILAGLAFIGALAVILAIGILLQ